MHVDVNTGSSQQHKKAAPGKSRLQTKEAWQNAFKTPPLLRKTMGLLVQLNEENVAQESGKVFTTPFTM